MLSATAAPAAANPAQAQSREEACHDVELDDTDAGSSNSNGTDSTDDAEADQGLERAQALNQFSKRQGHARVRPQAFTGSAGPIASCMRMPTSPEMLPEKTGWVDKASSSWFIGWQPRWLLLKDKTLKWYKSSDELIAQGTIDFDLVRCEVERLWSSDKDGNPQPPKPKGGCLSGRRGKCSLMQALLGASDQGSFRICAAGSNRALEFCVQGLAEAEAWVAALAQHLQRADVTKQHSALQLDGFSQSGGAWWKVHRISPEHFEQLAESGDVLLFRSKGTFPKLIRVASGGGRFDHVGLILRLQDGSIGLLESTGNEGVGLCTWREFVDNSWQELYPELALRRAHFRRSPEALARLQEWCSEVIGKPYGLTIGKLAQRSSVSTGGDDTTSNFFCSQLVAEALKVLGVIPRGLSSTQFWPSTFSAKRRPPIACSPGCGFGDTDLTIDFKLGSPEGKPRAMPEGGLKQRDATTNWG